MIIRRIQTADISQFEKIGMQEDGKPTLNLQRWLDAKRTKLEWCYIAEESGEFLARVIFGVFEDQPQDLKVWQLIIDNKLDNFKEVGMQLLKESINQLKSENFETVEYHLYANASNNFENYKSIFIAQGFEITQEKINFEATEIIQSDKTKSHRLTYKTLEEVGDIAFIQAIEKVTEGSLDREDLESIALNGSKKAAEMYFELLAEIDLNKNWWKLAYQEDGSLVGLIVPQKFSDEEGAINYIGVVPQKRGAGYVYALIDAASTLMFQSGIQTVIADIDTQNQPLEKALNVLGYVAKGSLSVLKLKIS